MSEMVLAECSRYSQRFISTLSAGQGAATCSKYSSVSRNSWKQKGFSTVIERRFEYYVSGRNTFEHFHDRLPGQPEAHRVKEVQPDLRADAHRIFAGFRARKYVHSNLEWDISPMGLERLERYVSEVLSVAHRKIDEEFVRKGMSA